MNSRQIILERLQAGKSGSQTPPKWSSGRHFEDPAARFKTMVEKVYGQVYRLPDLQAALEQLGQLLHELGASKVAANHEAPLDTANLPARLPDFEWFLAGQSEGDLRAFCAAADVGVSGAEAALAETGTLLVSSGAGRSRLVSLLPRVHIALLPTDRLLSDIFAWQESRHGQPLPANLVFVSGPSKTGDIEQTMSVGVHGPKQFIVLIYEPA